jgi:hypothetical protein
VTMIAASINEAPPIHTAMRDSVSSQP